MSRTIHHHLYLLAGGFLLLFSNGLFAQDQGAEEEKKIRFNGLGRTFLQNTEIGGEILNNDSTTVRSLTDGEFLLDLAVNATPNDQTEVQTILRLRNEFGGFFGAGVTVEVRELWAKGIIANVLKYRVGDMDHAMTPYTLYLPEEEGMVNEPEIFRPQKEVIYYEQFYTEGNRRRLQGAKLDFGLAFGQGLREAEVSGFIARIRGTDFFTTPSRFVGGGRIGLLSQNFGASTRAKLGLNLIHTWDDLQSGEANNGIRNLVYTADFDLRIFEKEDLALHLTGETGQSSLEFKEDSLSVFDESDSFLEVGATLKLKKHGLDLSAGFVDVGPDFFSTGAQSKRIDFDREKTYYQRIGNDRQLRMPTLFDLGRDRALYTYQLSDRLMPYDPRYSNTQPYGQATPNRRGLRLGARYASPKKGWDARLDAGLMKEIRGQGTFELKDFLLVRALANLNFDQMAEWEKQLRLTLGLQYEQTQRGGLPIEEVDLSSTLIEAGLQAELFTRFDLLLGLKFLTASGNDYIPLIEEFNDVKDFPEAYVVDDTETLLGGGFRYRFKEGIYLTLQYQRFDFSRATDPAHDYRFSQFFVLYNMNF